MKQEMTGSQQYQLNHTQIRENLIVQVFKDQMLFLKTMLNQRSQRQITYLDVFKHFVFPNLSVFDFYQYHHGFYQYCHSAAIIQDYLHYLASPVKN